MSESYTGILTDPVKHNRGSFVYLARATVENRLEEDLSRFHGQSDLPYLSCSYIANLEEPDIGHTTTFLPQGLLLKPASDSQFRVAFYKDLHSPPIDNQESWDSWLDNYGEARSDPEEILEKTPNPTMNHVVLEGNPLGSVQGVFYRGDNQERGTRLRETAEDILGEDLPLVEIPLNREVTDTGADRLSQEELIKEVKDLRHLY